MKVAKWGNSLAIRLPKAVTNMLDLKEGDDVAVCVGQSGALEISREMTREQALQDLRRFRGMISADFKFNRDEANAR